jgi:hypothetical protein
MDPTRLPAIVNKKDYLLVKSSHKGNKSTGDQSLRNIRT